MIELLRVKLNDDDDVGNRLAHITRTCTDTQSSVENNTIQARKKIGVGFKIFTRSTEGWCKKEDKNRMEPKRRKLNGVVRH